MKYCGSCGEKLEDQARFCENCGAVQEEAEAEAETQTPDLSPSGRKRGNPVIMVLATVILFLFCAAGGVWAFKMNQKKDPGMKAQTETSEMAATEKLPEIADGQTAEEKMPGKTAEDAAGAMSGKTTEEIVEAMSEKTAEDPGDTSEYTDLESKNIKSETKIRRETDTYLAEMKKAYENILHLENIQRVKKEQAGQPCDGRYTLADFDQNGSQDLVILKENGPSDETCTVYSYDGDTAVQIYNGPAIGYHLCEGQNGSLYGFFAKTGSVEITKLTWDNHTNTMTYEAIYGSGENSFGTEDYDAILQSFGLKQLRFSDIDDTRLLYGDTVEDTPLPAKSDVSERVIDGIYWQGGKSPVDALYYVQISNGSEAGFDFEIFGRDSTDRNFGTVFKYHNAVYTSKNTAVYFGKNYTLTFRWNTSGYLSVDGFSERISNTDILYNRDYLGMP